MKVTGTELVQDFQISTRGEAKPVAGGFEDTLNEQISRSVTSMTNVRQSADAAQIPAPVVSAQAATVLDQHEITFFEKLLNPMSSRYSKDMYGAQPQVATRLNRLA